MLRKIADNKVYIALAVIVLLFICVSFLSFFSIRQMQGNAKVINYAGIVRGGTQRLIKKELTRYPDDALTARLDSIVSELITGQGPNGLVALNDISYQSNMRKVQSMWRQIQHEIKVVRDDGDNTLLYQLSEEYFDLCGRTVSLAEIYSEKQVNKSMGILLVANGVFIIMILGGIFMLVRSVALSRRAETLGRLAYFDPLTQLPNRASCEQQVDSLAKDPPEDDLVVFMFDMNNLKRTNDQLGHQGGDRIISEFGRILRISAEEYGFVGRYGGDEFMAIFRNADDYAATQFIAAINEKVVAYNLVHYSELEKISFAAGYVVDNLKNNPIETMINEADRRMYQRKRQMKENDLHD